jgi:hypothetical protein
MLIGGGSGRRFMAGSPPCIFGNFLTGVRSSLTSENQNRRVVIVEASHKDEEGSRGSQILAGVGRLGRVSGRVRSVERPCKNCQGSNQIERLAKVVGAVSRYEPR